MQEYSRKRVEEITRATFEQSMIEFRNLGSVKSVRIRSASDACEACLALSEKVFALDEVPPLPHRRCTNRHGCRCTVGIEAME